MKDVSIKRRQAADETVFKIYKGVKTFDFSKTKNVLATGGKFYKEFTFSSLWPLLSYICSYFRMVYFIK